MSGKRKVFKYDQVLPALEKVVREKGADYVYEAPDEGECMYAEYDWSSTGYPYVGPSCVVGHVLIDLGLTPRDLRRLDDIEGVGVVVSAARLNVALHERGYVFSRKALALLGWAQTVQDDGGTWGHALEAAVDHAGAYGEDEG